MKAILFLLLAFVALSVASSVKEMMEDFANEQKKSKSDRKRANYQTQCSSYTCAKNGEECGYQSFVRTRYTTACINYNVDYCAVTQSGGNYNQGTCIRYATVGQSCGTANNNVLCAPGSTCDFFQNICIANPISNTTRYPGEQCGASNINCRYYNINSMSNENVCNNGVCKYTPNGSPCNDLSDNQCHYDSYCLVPTLSTTGTCTAKAPLNSACNIGDFNVASIDCVENLVCVPNTANTTAGVCRELYSQPEGSPCTDEETCKDGYCSDPVYTYKFGLCKDYQKTSTLNKACAGNNDCTTANGETCQCVNDEKSVCKHFNIEREYQDEINDYTECASDAETACNALNTVDRNKCYTDRCKKPFCKYYDSVKKVYGGQGNTPGINCNVIQYCGSASSLLISLPVLLVAAVFALL